MRKCIVLLLVVTVMAMGLSCASTKTEQGAATGAVIGGIVLRNSPHVPSLINRLIVGKYPCSAHGFKRSKVAPSRPINITL